MYFMATKWLLTPAAVKLNMFCKKREYTKEMKMADLFSLSLFIYSNGLWYTAHGLLSRSQFSVQMKNVLC